MPPTERLDRRQGQTLPVGVVAPLREELGPLLRRLTVDGRLRTATGRYYHGRLGGRAVVMGWTGDGRRRAAAGLSELLAAFPLSRLVVCGFAGGLSPGVVPEALIVAERVADARGDAPPPSSEWVAGVLRRGDALPGLLYSTEAILSSREAKAAVWRRLAEPRVAGVDLETATYARLADERAVPYLAVRVVSDAADESLPIDFATLQDAGGRVRRLAVVRRVLLQPSLVAPLRRLRQRVDRCAWRLATFVEAALSDDAVG